MEFQCLCDSQSLHTFSENDEYTKTLGVEWNAYFDHFQLVITNLPTQKNLTKRVLTERNSPCHCEGKDPAATPLGKRSTMGWFCTYNSHGYSGDLTCLVSWRSLYHFPKDIKITNKQLQIFRRFRARICCCCVFSPGWYESLYPHLTCDSKDESGNGISGIVEGIPPNRWNHVEGK